MASECICSESTAASRRPQRQGGRFQSKILANALDDAKWGRRAPGGEDDDEKWPWGRWTLV
jgi:hypothetical protein